MKFSLKIRIFLLIVFTVISSFLISAIILEGSKFFNENIIAGLVLFLILILAAGTTLYRFLRDVVVQASRIISGTQEGEEIDSESAFDSLRTSTAEVKSELLSYSKQLSFISNLLSRMGQGVILVDKNLKVLYFNQTITKDFFPELKVDDDLFKNISYPAFKKFIKKAWEKDEYTKEIAGPRTIKTVYLVSSQKFSTDDQLLIVFSDISKLKNLEKMRGDFIGNVSHELRTPISVIKANSETLLASNLIKDKNAIDFTKAIQSQSERMATIVNELLSISSMESGDYPISLDKLNIKKIVDSALKELEPMTKDKDIKLVNQLDRCPSVVGDESAMKIIISNYINNAIKHSPKKSSVIIDCEKIDKDFCRIQVRDSGSGIAKKYRERVFERFFRVDKGRSKKIGGTGLGLSISKNLALMMGYSVGVESNEPKGSIFYIDVKSHQEASREVA
ncbi:MAG: ATP-binding protein [Pseudomonadota bacterium]|nr:ATP-binding protein [Pseudomonadota bacterium]MEC9193056.1 ATP-binding protein [Pseudomonadota bacterium]